jgi:catechol 2,3-dioxygenase-like lactoylglutathione lyase family enzyme
MVRGIKFVGIPVRDQDVSLKFYTQARGLKVVTDQPFTDPQRWIELLIPGAERQKVTRGASASFSPLPSGVTTCSQPPKC